VPPCAKDHVTLAFLGNRTASSKSNCLQKWEVSTTEGRQPRWRGCEWDWISPMVSREMQYFAYSILTFEKQGNCQLFLWARIFRMLLVWYCFPAWLCYKWCSPNRTSARDWLAWEPQNWADGVISSVIHFAVNLSIPTILSSLAL